MKLGLLYLFAIANSKLIRRETESEDAQVVNTPVDQSEGDQTDSVATETDTEETEATETGNAGNTSVTDGVTDEQETGGDDKVEPANLQEGDPPVVDDSTTGEQTADGTTPDEATGGDETDSTPDDTPAGDDTAKEGEVAAATANSTDTSGDTGSSMTMMLSSVFVVLFMIIH